MENAIELYKPYRTRGGWKAVPVKVYLNGSFTVWNEKTDLNTGSSTTYLWELGHRYVGLEDPFDIVSEWREPFDGEFWVDVFLGSQGQPCFTVRDCDPRSSLKNDAYKTLACIGPIVWKEGDGVIS